jgi:hypothetical protein
MDTWNLTRHVTRSYSFVVITVQSLLMLYLVTYIYRHRKQKMTIFTGLMLFTIGLGLVIGFAEAVVFLIATDSNTSRNIKAEYFIFYGCGLLLSILSAVQNYVELLSALLLAHKYHVVALTIESVIKTGNFLHPVTQRNVFLLYVSLALACASSIVIEESLIWVFTINADLKSLISTETSNSIISILFLTLLTFLFAYSYVKITRTLKVS